MLEGQLKRAFKCSGALQLEAVTSVACLVLVLSAVLYSSAGAAAQRVTVDFFAGFHHPSLEALSDQQFKSPIGGEANILTTGGEGEVRNLRFSNPLPDLEPSLNAGVELGWMYSPKTRLLLGVSTWEASSRAQAFGEYAVQGEEAEVFNERLARVSYNEFYFGLRSTVVSRESYNIYYRATLNELYDIDYREDITFSFLTGPAEGVDKTLILKSQATGLLAFQPGLGFEYFFRDWLSIGAEASYLIGLRRMKLRDASSEVSFLTTDNLAVWSPQRVGPDGNLQYLNSSAANKDDYSDMSLSFDGWKVLFRMGLRF